MKRPSRIFLIFLSGLRPACRDKGGAQKNGAGIAGYRRRGARGALLAKAKNNLPPGGPQPAINIAAAGFDPSRERGFMY